MERNKNVNKIETSLKTGVDYFIFYLDNDIIKISSKTKKILGIKDKGAITLSQIKSIIIGSDVSHFVNQINTWIQGDTSNIIQIKIMDYYKMIRTIQIKGHLRYDSNGNIICIYGAYVDLTNLGN